MKKFVMKNKKEENGGKAVQGKEQAAAGAKTAVNEAAGKQAGSPRQKEHDYGERSCKGTEHQLLYEKIGLRTRNGKTYVANDGTMTTVLKNSSVHYQDPETGEWKDIDNRLTDTGDCLETKANAFKTRFIKHSKNGEIFEVQKGGCKATLISRELQENACCKLENCTCEDHPDTGEVLLRDVKEHIDIQYIVDSDRVKENIIVKEKLKEYDLNFDLSIENLTVAISDDKKNLELRDKKTGEVQFYIPGPFMTDAAGEYSEAVYYEIDTQNENTLSLKVVPDKRWMNSKNRVFPITIDPQIFVNQFKKIFSYEAWSGSGQFLGNMLKVFDAYNSDEKIFVENYGYMHQIHSKLKIYKNQIMIPQDLHQAVLSRAVVKLTLDKAHSPHPEGLYVEGLNYHYLSDSVIGFDIKDWLKSDSNIMEIYLGSYKTRPDLTFFTTGPNAPVLEIEYTDTVVKLEAAGTLIKTEYEPGEEIDLTGIGQLTGTYTYGEVREIPLEKCEIYLSETANGPGALTNVTASHDKFVRIVHENGAVAFPIKVAEGVNDRRPKPNFENIYNIIYVDEVTGNPTQNGDLGASVRLTLKDGAVEPGLGTALNAKNLNNLLVKGRNIRGEITGEDVTMDGLHITGSISKDVLPDWLMQKIADLEAGIAELKNKE